MAKPKGGRGNTVPYETKLVRVPIPLAEQVSALIERYQEWISGGGNPLAPPPLLDSLPFDKPVNEFNDDEQLGQDDMSAQPADHPSTELVNTFTTDAAIAVNELSKPVNELNTIPQWCVFYRDHEGKETFRGSYWTEYEANSRMQKLKSDAHFNASVSDQAWIPPGTYEVRQERVAVVQQESATQSSHSLVELKAELDQVRNERDELVELNNSLVVELDKFKTKNEVEQLPDLEAIRDRVLSSLRVGKQSPEYKRTKTAIDRFINELRGQVQ